MPLYSLTQYNAIIYLNAIVRIDLIVRYSYLRLQHATSSIIAIINSLLVSPLNCIDVLLYPSQLSIAISTLSIYSAKLGFRLDIPINLIIYNNLLFFV